MYEFATGVIDVWEKRLLSGLDQERMLKAPNKESAFMVLFDTDLSEIIAGGSKINIEDVFLQDLTTLKNKLTSVLNDNGLLIGFLFLKFDASNIKGILKRHYFKEETKNFKPFNFSIEAYKKEEEFLAKTLFNNQKEASFTEKISNVFVDKLLKEIVKKIEVNLVEGSIMSSEFIERIVDVAYFEVKYFLAKKEKALLEMVKLEIDMANLRSLLSKGNQNFLEEGNLSKDQIEGLASGKEKDLSNNLKKFLESLEIGFLLEGIQGLNLDITTERKIDSYIAKKTFQKEKEKGSGIEKVLAFFQKKMNSYTNIRLILFAKENNLQVEEIEKVLLPI